MKTLQCKLEGCETVFQSDTGKKYCATKCSETARKTSARLSAIKHRVELLAKQKIRRDTDEYRASNARYCRERKANDPIYYLAQLYRSRLSIAFNKVGGSATSTHSHEMLGCSYAELPSRLAEISESPWSEGMALDHVLPLALAKTKEELMYLAHWTNLQYLTDEENKRKGSKLDYSPNQVYLLKLFNSKFRDQ